MTVAEAVLALMFLGLTAYALFAGADFGAGIWDLLAGGTHGGRARRDLIEHSLAPVWEANHVWLIFVLVVLWTGFPPGFAAIASTLYIPLTLAALGMIARGSAFAFRKTVPSLAVQRLFGAAFAFSSFVTPYFLGAVVGGIASGRVPPGIATGDVVTSWVNPTSALAGVLAIGTCAYLAAVLLCADARREGSDELAAHFRGRGLATAVLVGAVALGGVLVLRADAPDLYDGLTHRGLPLMVVSGLAGIGSIGLLLARRYTLARVAAGLAVTAVLWGWAAAQYPYLLPPTVTIEDAAASRTTLVTMLVSLLIGAVLLVPALVYLYTLFQRGHRHDPAGRHRPVEAPVTTSPDASPR
jgi:cytochrome d ubiquinol oxidase subunit II